LKTGLNSQKLFSKRGILYGPLHYSVEEPETVYAKRYNCKEPPHYVIAKQAEPRTIEPETTAPNHHVACTPLAKQAYSPREAYTKRTSRNKTA
jgi:hypothetical protein